MKDILEEQESDKYLRILKNKLRRIDEGIDKFGNKISRSKPKDLFHHHHSVGGQTKTKLGNYRTLDKSAGPPAKKMSYQQRSQGNVKQSVVKASVLTQNGRLPVNGKSSRNMY